MIDALLAIFIAGLDAALLAALIVAIADLAVALRERSR